MKQTIDISPEKVAPIAVAATRFLNLETTLIPGNLKNQLAVLEVFLSGLASGELVLATPPRAPVESDAKSDGAGEKEPDLEPDKKVEEPDGPKTRPPTPEEIGQIRDAAYEQSGAGEGQSG